MAVTYTPNVNDALQDGFAGVPFDDPGAYTTPKNRRVDGRYFLKPVQDEIQALIAGRVSSVSYFREWDCSNSVDVGDPVRIEDGALVLASAANPDHTGVLGFVRYKTSPTSCLLDHFFQLGGFSGTDGAGTGGTSGTLPLAGQPVYLSDTGRYSDIPGSNVKVVGVFANDDIALLFANPLTAAKTELIITAMLADGAVTTPKLADNAVSTSKLADDSVQEFKINASALGNGLTGGSGTVLSVSCDNTSIGIVAGKVASLQVYPRAAISRSTSAAIPNNSTTPIVQDTSEYDTDTMVNLGSFSSLLTIKTAGLYIINAAGSWDFNATGDRHLQLLKNGSVLRGNSTLATSSLTWSQFQELSTKILLAVNDTIQLNVVQTSGSTLNFNNARLEAYKLP